MQLRKSCVFCVSGNVCKNGMATILELANHAGLSSETVLRVILREPVNEDARRRVAAAVEALGPPDYPRPDGSIEVLPADSSGTALSPATQVPAREEEMLPERLRAELGEFREACERIVSELRAQRRERIEDLELVTDLLTAGWRGVDRRLGRLEKVIARIDETQRTSGQATTRANPNVIRFEPRSHDVSPSEDADTEPGRA
jgi:hypothetical protein